MNIGVKIIAVDFDGTLCENKWPEIGEPHLELIEHIKAEKTKGTKIVLWTCRSEERLEEAVTWCNDEHGLYFDAVNDEVEEVKHIFGEHSGKIYADIYIDDKACRQWTLPFVKAKPVAVEELTWAEKEIDYAILHENPSRKQGEFDYGCTCYENALEAYNTLMRKGHTGFSLQLTKSIINRLIDSLPLTSIPDVDELWEECENGDSETRMYQNRRFYSLFKYVESDGEVVYKDINRCYGVYIDPEKGGSFQSGLISSLINELYPITLPYYPHTKRYKVVCDDHLCCPSGGDYDTMVLLYGLTPDGERFEINRYYKDNTEGPGFIEIDRQEYEKRITVE